MKQIGIVILVTIALVILAVFVRNSLNQKSLVPTTNTQTSNTTSSERTSQGKTSDIAFILPSGFVIHIFAEGLGAARDLQFSPGGTLLVSNPSSGNIYALPDKNNDGVADSKKIIISGENHPHGLAFHNNKLYVADVNQIVRFNFDESSLTATKEKVLFSLPENNNHNNRTITFDKDGKMFVSVGSTCNVCIEKSSFSATVLVSDAEGNNPKVFARGLRNAPFIQFNPKSGELWGTEMGRDLLGDNIPPDEIGIIKEGKDYGWPNCYGNKVPDTNFNQNANCVNTESPIFEIPAHSAPLGLTFINSPQFPSDFQGDLLVGYHGSWNRSTPTGYKVVHLKVSGNTITNSEDFLTGFISPSATQGSEAKGRPVDLTFDSLGNLYLSDDRLGNVYIIQKQ